MTEFMLRWLDRDYLAIVFLCDGKEVQAIFHRDVVDFSDDGDCALLKPKGRPEDVAWIMREESKKRKPLRLLPVEVEALENKARATLVCIPYRE